MNLLIVDDEAIAIRGMMDGVDWKGCGIDGSIWTAYNVEHALRILNTQQVDILLCDIEMPGYTGIDLLRAIRENGGEIACIFLTCHANFAYAQEAISLGCSDYILKPAPYEVVEERLRKVCETIRARKKDAEFSRYRAFAGEEPENGETGGGVRTQKDIVRQVEEYIRQHLDDCELLVSGIADAMFLNKDYLNRIFKKEHGISISQYLIQERMKLAAVLLENPQNTVNMVAERTGYNNYPYFASSFKRYHGCSPSQYKKDRE